MWHTALRISTQLNSLRGLSIITGLDYWNGLLEWTTGLTFFCAKNHFYGLYRDFLNCKTASCFRSISHSIIYLTAQSHT